MAQTKIRAEMEQNANDPYVQVVGNFLLQYITDNPGAAGHILDEGKSIKESLKAMETEARKKKVGNVAVLTDAEGFAVVLMYYGIEGTPVLAQPIRPAAPKVDFDVNLDDLLPKL
jgi:hypothetical protein